jgi:hypothetical protein
MAPIAALLYFLGTGSVALFSFVAVAAWSGSRLAERQAYYKSEVLKKIAESQGPGPAAALELMREEERIAVRRRREGMVLGGVITISVGLALMIFLKAVVPGGPPVYLCGLIPLFVGFALLGYHQFLTPKA